MHKIKKARQPRNRLSRLVWLASLFSVTVAMLWALGSAKAFVPPSDNGLAPAPGPLDKPPEPPEPDVPRASGDEFPLREAAAAAKHRILVVDRVTLIPVEGVKIIASNPLRVIATTNQNGRAESPDNLGDLLAFHDDYLLQTVAAPAAASSDELIVSLQVRPRVSCVIHNATVEALRAHTFVASLTSDQDSLLRELMKVLGRSTVPSEQWNGFGMVEMRPAIVSGCGVIVVARPLAGVSISEYSTKLEPVRPVNQVAVVFSPPLRADAVGVTISAVFNCDGDRDIEFSVVGPVDSVTGRAVRGARKVLEKEGRSNQAIQAETTVFPGKYKWRVTVIGVGNYDVGEFVVPAEGGRLDVSGGLEFVSGVLVVHGEGRETDLRVLDGFVSVSGHVFSASEFANGQAEWSYSVPKGSELYAIAYHYSPNQASLPVRLPTNASGARVDIRQWSECKYVSFEIAGSESSGQMYSIEVVDELTGMRSITPFSSRLSVGPIGLLPSRYRARVDGGAKAGLWTPFDVPGASPIVLIP